MAAAAVAASAHNHSGPGMEGQISRRSVHQMYDLGRGSDASRGKDRYRDSRGSAYSRDRAISFNSDGTPRSPNQKFDPTPYRLYDLYNTEQYAMLNAYDKQVRRLNLIMFGLSALSIIIATILLEVTWDPGLGNWRPPTVGEFITKWLLLFNTVALLYFLISYYKLQKQHEHKTWFIPDSIPWRKKILRNFLLELIVCGITPVPDTISGDRLYDNTLVTFLVFRLYLVVRVIRDHCPVYRQRAGIIQASFADRRIGTPTFNWVLTTRYFFFHYMWLTVLFLLFFFMFVFAYGVLVLERTVSPDWNFRIALWNTVVTMTTVGYGDYSPSFEGAQFCQAMAAFVGILLTSLTIFVVVESLDYSSVERLAYNRYKLRGISTRQRKLAARYIQFMWRFRRWNSRDRPRCEVAVVNKVVRDYTMKNREYKKKLQHYRRQQTKIMADERKRSAGVPAFEAAATNIMHDLRERDDVILSREKSTSQVDTQKITDEIRQLLVKEPVVLTQAADVSTGTGNSSNKAGTADTRKLNGRLTVLEKQMEAVLKNQGRILAHLDRWDKEYFAPQHNTRIAPLTDDPVELSVGEPLSPVRVASGAPYFYSEPRPARSDDRHRSWRSDWDHPVYSERGTRRRLSGASERERERERETGKVGDAPYHYTSPRQRARTPSPPLSSGRRPRRYDLDHDIPILHDHSDDGAGNSAKGDRHRGYGHSSRSGRKSPHDESGDPDVYLRSSHSPGHGKSSGRRHSNNDDRDVDVRPTTTTTTTPGGADPDSPYEYGIKVPVDPRTSISGHVSPVAPSDGWAGLEAWTSRRRSVEGIVPTASATDPDTVVLPRRSVNMSTRSAALPPRSPRDRPSLAVTTTRNSQPPAAGSLRPQSKVPPRSDNSILIEDVDGVVSPGPVPALEKRDTPGTVEGGAKGYAYTSKSRQSVGRDANTDPSDLR